MPLARAAQFAFEDGCGAAELGLPEMTRGARQPVEEVDQLLDIGSATPWPRGEITDQRERGMR